METKKLSLNDIKVMSIENCNEVLNTVKNLSPAQKQALSVRITHLSTPAPEETAPVEAIQNQIAEESISAPEDKAPEEVVPVVATTKNKPFETTRTIESFKDDTKGIRAGTMVTFTENNKPDAKVMVGQVQRLFDFWAKPERQEAKIMVTDTKGNKKRFYRFEKDITPVVEVPAEEVNEGEGI